MLFGLLTALCWGAADFLIKLLGSRLSLRASIVWAQGMSAAVVLAAMVAIGHVPFAALERAVLPFLAAAAFANAVGNGLLYAAFQNGRVAVVAPLIGSYAIVATLLGILAGTEALSLPLGAILAAIGGGALLVMCEGGGAAGLRPRVGALAAGSSALASGVSIWVAAAYVLPTVPVTDLLLANFGLLALCALVWPTRDGLAVPGDRRTWGVILGIAISTAAGYGAYNTGLATGGIAVVSILSTLSSAVTLLLAMVTLGERVSGVQRIGLAIVLVGLPVLAAVRELW